VVCFGKVLNVLNMSYDALFVIGDGKHVKDFY